MSESVVAKRYADALFQLGTEKNMLDQFVDELTVVKEVFQQNNELYVFLENPRIDKLQKNQFIDKVFQGMSKDVVHTIMLLNERHRIDSTTSVIDHFIQMVNDVNGVAKAKVYSVRKLSETELKELESTFAKRFNKQTVKFDNVIDPSILGGMKIRIGNTILDGTITGKLQKIERNLKLANN